MNGDTSVTFHSPTDNLALVITPANRKMNDQGLWDTIPGKKVQFRNGRFETADSAELGFLRNHPELGRLFHEHGAERGRQSDSSSAMVAYIVELAIEGQADTIADILVAERNSFSRPEVLAACEKALERIGAMVPAPPPPPEHQLERVRLPGPVGPSPQGFDGTERPIGVGPTAGDPSLGQPTVPGGQPGPAIGQQPISTVPGQQPTVPQQ